VVQVAGASICGSDLHMAEWHPMARWMKTPVILGHEFAGVVAEVGSAVRSLRAGDRIAVESVIWCGQCPPCRAGKTNVCNERRLFGIHEPGGLAEAVAVPEKLTHRVPASLAVECAALAEPTTVALHAVMLQRGSAPGQACVAAHTSDRGQAGTAGQQHVHQDHVGHARAG